jgi:hypothetical protein
VAGDCAVQAGTKGPVMITVALTYDGVAPATINTHITVGASVVYVSNRSNNTVLLCSV